MSCKSVGLHELQNQLIIFKSLKSTVESISITQFLQVLLMLNDEFQKQLISLLTKTFTKFEILQRIDLTKHRLDITYLIKFNTTF